MNIRHETPEDYHEAEQMIREAFWDVYRPKCFEHYVVHNLRNDKCYVPELSYIVENEGKIIAGIYYAMANIDTDDGEKKEMLIFGPVGVLPEYQHMGYGKLLIERTMDEARQLGYPAVAITGNPFYYYRFGFESASKHGIYYKGLSRQEESPFFMISIFDDDKVKLLRGTYSDPDVYYTDDDDVRTYDKNFPEKESHKADKGETI